MYGWRSRIGLLLPLDNAVIEPEFAGLCPEGTNAFTIRLDTAHRPDMPAAGVRASAGFNELDVDVVGYACAETSFLDGEDVNDWLQRGISETTGRPSVTATTAMATALTALGVRSLAVAAPYPEASMRALTTYLDARAVDVVSAVARDYSTTSKDPRDWWQTNREQPSEAYRLARSADHAAAEAVFIAATNLRSVEIIEQLRRDLGKPVLSSNTAMLWWLLRASGVHDDMPALGALNGVELPESSLQ